MPEHEATRVRALLPGPLARGHQLQPGGPRVSATTAASPSASPSPSPETSEKRAARLTSAFQAMLRKYVPGATWTADTSDPYLSRDGAFVFVTAQAGLRTDGDTHDGAGTGNVWVDVEQLGGDLGASGCAQASTSRYTGGKSTCEQRTVAGATVIVQVDTAPNGSFTNQITVARPADATLVTIMSSNYGGSSVVMVKSAPTPDPQRATAPLSVAAEQAIGTAPAMHY